MHRLLSIRQQISFVWATSYHYNSIQKFLYKRQSFRHSVTPVFSKYSVHPSRCVYKPNTGDLHMQKVSMKSIPSLYQVRTNSNKLWRWSKLVYVNEGGSIRPVRFSKPDRSRNACYGKYKSRQVSIIFLTPIQGRTKVGSPSGHSRDTFVLTPLSKRSTHVSGTGMPWVIPLDITAVVQSVFRSPCRVLWRVSIAKLKTRQVFETCQVSSIFLHPIL